nr:UDP-N-acetylmuramoylalanine--D-glutamate ligase-like [Nerophis lumbriciformis]
MGMEMQVPWSEHGWRRVAVYGLGLSGRAAAALLRSRGVEVVAFDARPASALDLGPLAGDPGLELRLGAEPDHLPEGLDGVVTSPGVPFDRPILELARRQGLPVVAEVELAFALLDGEVVAITGSNGKSTTTALVGELLRRAGRQVEVCGNIGRPLAAAVDGPAGRVFVVELSSFQLETVDQLRPQAAALLNLSADHLDRHGLGDVAVLGGDDPQIAALALPQGVRRRTFALRAEVEDGCRLQGDRVVEHHGDGSASELFGAADLRLVGRHNLENAMAAALLARAVEAEPVAIRDGVAAFAGLPHRLQWVVERDGVSWFDDSKGTNPGATARSLEGFGDGSIHLILGGRNKGADFSQLRDLVVQKARRVYLIGEAASELEGALGGSVDGPAFEAAGTLNQAVASASRHAVAGEAVVLSPACASFDQFRSFAERGEVYQRLVREFGEGGGDGT